MWTENKRMEKNQYCSQQNNSKIFTAKKMKQPKYSIIHLWLNKLDTFI